MHFDKKYSSKVKKRTPNSRPQNLSSTSLDKGDSRLGMRKQKTGENEEKKELELNPDSPFLREQSAEFSQDDSNLQDDDINTGIEVLNLKNFRIARKNQKSQEDILEMEVSSQPVSQLEEDFFIDLEDVKGNTSEESSLQEGNEEEVNLNSEDFEISSENQDEDFNKEKELPQLEEKPIKITEKNEKETKVSQEEDALRKERLAMVRSSNKRTPTPPWQWVFVVRPATVLTFLLLMSILLGFFFVFGLIVGRGLSPLPEAPTPISIMSEKEGELEIELSETLPMEELKYSQALKNDDEEASASEEISEIVPYPIGNGLPPVREGNTLESSTKTPSTSQASTSLGIFDYSLRTATFKNKSHADEFSQKLKADGLRAEVQQKGSWYFVNIDFRGTEDNFEKMRTGLKKYGIQDSIIVSKVELKLD